MSAVEATKPVEAAVVAPTETATEAPVVAEPAPVETATAEPVITSETAAEATEAAAIKEEVKPVEEGILGYKGPGLLKSFIFQKKFFWFGTDAVESKALSSYLRGEKQQELANKNVAWASSTGKGLLFFSKKASEKATPHGVFNLSEISDITEDGTVAFAFTSAGHKHIFEASTLAERDNWVSVLKAKSVEATELAPTVVESEEYKKAHADLLPKAPLVAAAAAKDKEEAKAEKKEEVKEEKKEAKEEKKEEKKEVKEEKKEARKSRSASRKRASIFGGFNLGGKKEEKTDAPKEDAVVAVPTEETSVAPVEPVVAAETSEAAPVVPEAAPMEKPVPVKRNSIFGNLKFGQNKEKKVEAEAPAVPAKDAAEPVSETAPVIPAVEASEPLATSVASPATVPTETVEAPVANGETKVETPTTKSDKRKSSLPFFTKKEKVTSDEEVEKVEKPKSPGPFAKLRATVKGKSSPKTEKVADKPAETSAEDTTVPEPTTAAEPVVSEPEPVVPQTTPQVVASA